MSERSVGLRVGFSSPLNRKRSISVISTNYPLCIAEAARLQFGQAVRRDNKPDLSAPAYYIEPERKIVCGARACTAKPPAIFRNTEQRKSGDEEYLKGKP